MARSKRRWPPLLPAPGPERERGRVVITLGNVSAKISSSKRSTAKQSKRKAGGQLLSRAAATPPINGSRIQDRSCSNLGCWAWRFDLDSISYYDRSYAWGTRSRYGYVGRINCTASATGYSTTREECRFHGDPSPYGLYAAAQYQISAAWPLNFNKEHYLHRHYDKNGRYWLVAS